MKKALGFFLALVLVLALLPASALAADRVVLSPQRLCVDGVIVECEKYNINNYNYFKLRDIAMLLNGTGSQFSVNYDEELRTISVVTGEEYVPIGSELDLSQGDKSASAKPGSQPLLINGELRTDIAAYNLANNNFYKLKDLGKALGFDVQYEPETNTAIIVSKRTPYPTEWLTVEQTYLSNDGSWSREVQTYDEAGNLLTSRYEGDNWYESSVHTYDWLGRETERRSEYGSSYGDDSYVYHESVAYTYNLRGQLASENNQSDGDVSSSVSYTYDDMGNILTRSDQTNAGTTVYSYVYDEDGWLIRSTTESDEYSGSIEYVRDAQGNLLKEESRSNGRLEYATESIYENGLVTKYIYTSGDGSTSTTYYTYDAQGRLLRTRYESDYGGSETTYTYDAAGNTTEIRTVGESYASTVTYTYDASGNILTEEDLYENYYDDGGDMRYLYAYTYDAQGRLLTETYTWNGCVTETVYTYDTAARKQTVVSTTTYPPAEGLELSEEELTLAVGDEYSLYFNFLPYSSAAEAVTWGTSDPGVARVDQNGCVTAVAAGTAVISAVSETGLAAECTVTVSAEKFILTVEPESVAVRKGSTVTVLCTLECVGVWESCKLTRSAYDDAYIYPYWDEDWEGMQIGLNITGVGTGSTSITVYPTQDGIKVGEAVAITITVVN